MSLPTNFNTYQRPLSILLFFVLVVQSLALARPVAAQTQGSDEDVSTEEQNSSAGSGGPSLGGIGSGVTAAAAAATSASSQAGLSAAATASCATAAAAALTPSPSFSVPTTDWTQYTQQCAANQKAALRTNESVWQKTKDLVLNPLAKMILRVVVREMKRQVINYIVTGEFGEPRFVTNFYTDAKLAAENAARTYLSQLTGINFCGFFPVAIPAVYALNFNFQFQCTISSSLYKEYLKNPILFTDLERLLILDPSTNYTQTVISAGQTKAEQIAQALVANAASKTNGFIGDTAKVITGQERSEFNARKKAAGTAASLEAGRASLENSRNIGLPNDVALQLADNAAEEARKAAEAKVPEPKGTDRIRTPGQIVQETINHTLLGDTLGPIVADEFDQAVAEIVDTAVSVIVNKGLDKAFGR